jgi:membrane-bound serine protease (ClpP class)
MVGCTATAMEPLSPEGHVLVEGEIWRAVAAEPVAAGARLRVVSHEQQLLKVVPAAGPGSPQPPA